MIRSFRHKGMRELYEGGASAKVSQQHVQKLLRILSALDEAAVPAEMNLPGFQLHSLKGNSKGHYAISVLGNWRVTFRFEGVNAVDVNYLDYH